MCSEIAAIFLATGGLQHNRLQQSELVVKCWISSRCHPEYSQQLEVKYRNPEMHQCCRYVVDVQRHNSSGLFFGTKTSMAHQTMQARLGTTPPLIYVLV